MATDNTKALDIRTIYQKHHDPTTPGLCPPSNAEMSPSIIVVGITAILIVAPALGNWCTLAPDSFDYLTTARTLHETGRYPDYHMMRPPGFPTLIAPLFQFGNPPLLAIRLLLAACFVATGVLTTALLHKPLGRFAAIAAGLLTVTNSVLLMQTTVALSEAVFIPLQLAALIVIEKSRRAASIRTALLSGLLVSCAIMVRTIGAALVPVGAAVILLQKNCPWRRRLLEAAAFVAISASLPTLWHLRQLTYSDQSGYGRMWTHPMEAEQTKKTGIALQFERFKKFGAERLVDIKRAIIPNRIGWRAFQSHGSPFATAITAIIVIGACLFRFAHARSAAEVYALIVLFVVALWPWDEGVRLVAPLIPIFYGSLVWLAFAASERIGRYQTIAPCLLLTIALGLHTWEAIETQSRISREKAKADLRLSKARSFSETLVKIVPLDSELICVTQNASNAKLTFAGGVFFSKHRKIRYLDVLDGKTVESGNIGENYAAIESKLFDSTYPTSPNSILFRDEEFVITTNSR